MTTDDAPAPARRRSGSVTGLGRVARPTPARVTLLGQAQPALVFQLRAHLGGSAHGS